MIQTIELKSGVTLRCFRDDRFKQGAMSVQFLRPLCKEEAALNALIPAVLLRGTRQHPDLRRITLHLDDLYGASIGALVRKVGDLQTTGLYCSFMDDRFALEQDQILEPAVSFLSQLLLDPVLEDGCFSRDFMESEKRNLILAIESQRNDKRQYANAQLLYKMCQGDPYGVPRLGNKEQVAEISAEDAYRHYQKILQESPIHIFYVGGADPEKLARLLRPVVAPLASNPMELPSQTGLQTAPTGEHTECLDVTQGKLCVGFATPITLRQPEFAAMQVMNMIFGGGMTSKLFMQVREKQSLCYDIGSGYHGSKGLVTVSAGIEFAMKEPVLEQIRKQLAACCEGDFTEEELAAAKQGLLTQLQSTHDSPGAIENYYASGLLSGLNMTTAQYMERVEKVTAQQVQAAARSLQEHTVYFLKGEQV